MRFFFDTEFIDNGNTIDLISIGIVDDRGNEFYAENSDCDHGKACEWVKLNVLPKLLGTRAQLPKKQIAIGINNFVGPIFQPEFWAWYGAYDWVAFSQLYGRMIDVPSSFPHFVRDIRLLCDYIPNAQRLLPDKPKAEHNALADAHWTKQAFEVIQKHLPIR